MGQHPSPASARAGLDRSIQRILRGDEHATPEVARRQLIAEVAILLRTRHTLAPHPDRHGHAIVLDGYLKRVRVIPADVAEEAQQAYRREVEARDPAAVPVELGRDGRRVDPLELCREVGLPRSIAEHGSGEVLMTADVAQAILSRNNDNRPLSRPAVERFAQLMDEGRWKLTTDAIGIDANGRVVNGQHRLEALLLTCEPQPFLVKLNVDPDAFPVIDSGRPRSPSDALHIAGFTQRNVRAAVIRLVVHASRGHLWTSPRRVEADEVLEHAEKLEPQLSALIQEGEGYRRRSNRLVNGTHATFMLWAYGEAHGAGIREYLERLAKGFGIEEGQPAGTVRNALVANLQAYPKLPGIGILALMVRGAEAHIAGQPMQNAKVQGARAWPSLSVMGWPPQAVATAGRKQEASRLEAKR